MADISQINLPGDSSFNVKDAVARSTKADKVALPPAYDPTLTYSVGDFCTYNGDAYVCQRTFSTPEAWDSSHWILDSQQDYLHSINPSGIGSFSLNRRNGTDIGILSFAAGRNGTASGNYSHAEGDGANATGMSSHAEGISTTASREGAHAEGVSTTSSGISTHAEGRDTRAYGHMSHAEGDHTTSVGEGSHAEGYYTKTTHRSQHVFGEYNVLDSSTAYSSQRGNYVEIIGNGTADDARSNARTLDWSGNEVLAGRLKVNGTQDVPIIYEVTQSQYDALKQAGTLVHNALYVITDAQNLNATASDIEYSSGVSVKTKIDSKADKPRLAWSGNIYQQNDTATISNFDNTKFYVIECISFTGGNWHNFTLCYGGHDYWQVSFWGDNTQYCRYRIYINSSTGVATLSEVLGSGTNTAIVKIWEIA